MQTLGFGFTTLSGRNPAPSFSLGDLSGIRVWYAPSDISSLFQDAAMTVPVIADGDPVGAMKDMSGHGHHAFQTNLSKRPIYRNEQGKCSLEFDGSTTFLSMGVLDMSGTDEVFLATGVKTMSSTSIGTLCELSESSSSNVGTFALFDRGVSGGAVSWRSRGLNSSLLTVSRGASLPVSSVYVCTGKISTDVSTLRRNGVEIGSSTADQGSGNFSASPLYLGARAGGSYYFKGQLYGLCIATDLQSITTTTKVESYLSAQTT